MKFIPCYKLINKKLFKLTGSNYFDNLPSFVLIIFFLTITFLTSPTVIRLIRDENCSHHKNLDLQVGKFLSKLPCFSFFTFTTKGFNLAIQVPTAEIHTYGISFTSLWSLTSDNAANVIIPDSPASAMICASWESIPIMDFFPVFAPTFQIGFGFDSIRLR